MNLLQKWFCFLLSVLIIAGCSSSKKISAVNNSISSIRFINEYVIPHGMLFDSTTVGGLSGIDYDQKREVYYFICDDPSANGPARFYTGKLFFTEKGIDSVAIIDMTPILNSSGKTYPDIRKDRTHSLDAEALRYNAATDELILSSEGQRFKNPEGKLLIQDPAILVANRDGSYKDSFALPQNMHIRETENGPRHNSVFEGLTFSDDYRYLYVSVEEPVYEDGARAATGDSTSWIRLLKFDVQTRKQVAQYAYETDAVPYAANPPGAFKINGVPDILYAGNDQFIVIERAYITGRKPSYIRVFLADAKKASNIAEVNSLKEKPASHPLKKKLLLNMESLNRYTDNIEGVSFGPLLPNGHRTLLFVADNNFSENEISQIFLFEIMP